MTSDCQWTSKLTGVIIYPPGATPKIKLTLHCIHHYTTIITINDTDACCCGCPKRKASKAFCELYLIMEERLHQLTSSWITKLIICGFDEEYI